MKIKITITTILNTIIKSKTIKITNEEFLSFQNILQDFSNLKYISFFDENNDEIYFNTKNIVTLKIKIIEKEEDINEKSTTFNNSELRQKL
jgi:hypothetical protein